MALKSKPLEQVRDTVPVSAVADMVRVNLEVPKATRTAWRAAALQRDMPLSELIREAMRNHLKQ